MVRRRYKRSVTRLLSKLGKSEADLPEAWLVFWVTPWVCPWVCRCLPARLSVCLSCRPVCPFSVTGRVYHAWVFKFSA